GQPSLVGAGHTHDEPAVVLVHNGRNEARPCLNVVARLHEPLRVQRVSERTSPPLDEIMDCLVARGSLMTVQVVADHQYHGCITSPSPYAGRLQPTYPDRPF